MEVAKEKDFVAKQGDRMYDLDQPKIIDQPIKQPPEDILREIFEYLPVMDSEGEHGHILAQVCRQWRWLALGIPALWIRVRFKSTLPPAELLELRELAASRARTAAVTVIYTIMSQVSREVIGICPLDKFQDIDGIIIRFRDYWHLVCALNWIGGQQVRVIRKLELTCYSITERSHVHPTALNLLVEKLSPSILSLDSLELRMQTTYMLSGFATIRRLNLSDVRGDAYKFHMLLQHLPALEYLATNKTVAPGLRTASSPILLNKINAIDIFSGDFPWKLELRCQILERVSIHGSISSELLQFLRQNPSITTLELHGSFPFDALTSAAPQITHLLVNTHHSLELLSLEKDGRLPFPLLQSITIIKNDKKTSYWHKVSNLIEVRCLPAGTVQNSAKRVQVLRLGSGWEFCEELSGVPWPIINTEHGTLREYVWA